MKPLNHKERDDKFLYFVIAGTISLGITIFCLYFTNYLLIEAIGNKQVEEYSRFQQYKRNQQQYTKQLEQINKSLSDNFSGSIIVSKMITDLKTSYIRNGDTTALMNKIADLLIKDARLIDQRNQSRAALSGVKRALYECNTKLKKNG